ncbi:DUF6265 family protein [Nonlabens marinus]|uniref:Lipocalin-like domain-containing protein n=1 Tax=Nonlabens marinus S1-08 TaxID=1454201 RepID=W8VUR3_9FLAO|nr:DUF6265 family protein [Nonlabens marinus]BAO54828.1 hypothetical protein NMS_0819 [Nonlabens marinus S1-08]
MKYIFFLLLLLVSCKPTSSIDEGSLDWILGDWKRVDDKVGQQTFENWQKSTDDSYQGFGYTLKAGDTVFKEYMRLYKDSTWILEVSGVNDSSVSFQMTDITPNSFTVENSQHDFPTKIKYWINDDSLKAYVSNVEMRLDFSFVKQ